MRDISTLIEQITLDLIEDIKNPECVRKRMRRKIKAFIKQRHIQNKAEQNANEPIVFK